MQSTLRHEPLHKMAVQVCTLPKAAYPTAGAEWKCLSADKKLWLKHSPRTAAAATSGSQAPSQDQTAGSPPSRRPGPAAAGAVPAKSCLQAAGLGGHPEAQGAGQRLPAARRKGCGEKCLFASPARRPALPQAFPGETRITAADPARRHASSHDSRRAAPAPGAGRPCLGGAPRKEGDRQTGRLRGAAHPARAAAGSLRWAFT